MRDIKLPMSAEDAASLQLGEMVTVSGMLFTGRSRFHIRAAENDIYPGEFFFHLSDNLWLLHHTAANTDC